MSRMGLKNNMKILIQYLFISVLFFSSKECLGQFRDYVGYIENLKVINDKKEISLSPRCINVTDELIKLEEGKCVTPVNCENLDRVFSCDNKNIKSLNPKLCDKRISLISQIKYECSPQANNSPSTTATSKSATTTANNGCEGYTPNEAIINEAIINEAINGLSIKNPSDHCRDLMSAFEKHKSCSDQTTKIKKAGQNIGYSECLHLLSLSRQNGFPNIQWLNRESSSNSVTSSTVGLTFCSRTSTSTVDFDPCKKMLNLLTGVAIAEIAMDAEQKIRTDLKNKNIAEDVQEKIKEGQGQTAAYDAALESNDHLKKIQTEKMIAYTAALTALGLGIKKIPGEKDAIKMCESGASQIEKAKQDEYNANGCASTIKKFSSIILANQTVKAEVLTLMTRFVSKGVEAGILHSNLSKNIAAIENMNQNLNEGTDVMLELCQFNPADPACLPEGQRVKGNSSFSSGQNFTVGNGQNNNFGVNPEQSSFGEAGNATSIDDLNQVADITSPFRDQAKEAKGILDPAAPAVAQPGGGSGGGGGGGGGIGGGGGGASLGNDLEGPDKSTPQEGDIKPGKVTNAYANAGGGGFKGLGKAREDANPFSDLFSKKGPGGGVEEERSIASGDVDGKSIDLFKKISNRYGQIKAQNRLETKNLDE